MSNHLLDVKGINELDYTSFVGLVNQWNVPPGAYSTLNKWQVFGHLDEKSSLLEIACTTGFSSRELTLSTGCTATGIDISKESINAARHNAKKYAKNAKLNYKVMDALQFNPKETYSHILTGASLRFFSEPEKALNHLTKLLAPNGYILSSEFYCSSSIPARLVKHARDVFGITVTQMPYKDVMAIYRPLTLIYEDRNVPIQESDEEIQYYCDSTVATFAKEHPEYNENVLEAIHKRLHIVKTTSNELRPYQRYNVLVHKMDNRYYPRRYTEIF